MGKDKLPENRLAMRKRRYPGDTYTILTDALSVVQLAHHELEFFL